MFNSFKSISDSIKFKLSTPHWCVAVDDLWLIFSRYNEWKKKAKLFFMARRTNWKRTAMYLAEKFIIFCFVSVLSRSLVFPFSLFSDYLRADVKYRGNIHWTSLLWQNIEIWREINLFFVFKDGESYRKFVKLAIANTIDYVIFLCHNFVLSPSLIRKYLKLFVRRI